MFHFVWRCHSLVVWLIESARVFVRLFVCNFSGWQPHEWWKLKKQNRKRHCLCLSEKWVCTFQFHLQAIAMRNLSRQPNHTLKSDKKLNIFGRIAVGEKRTADRDRQRACSVMEWEWDGWFEKEWIHTQNIHGFLYTHFFSFSLFLFLPLRLDVAAFCWVLKGKITFTEWKNNNK